MPNSKKSSSKEISPRESSYQNGVHSGETSYFNISEIVFTPYLNQSRIPSDWDYDQSRIPSDWDYDQNPIPSDWDYDRSRIPTNESLDSPPRRSNDSDLNIDEAQKILENKKYKNVEYLNEGAFAIVFKSKNPEGKLVAAKVIHSPQLARIRSEMNASKITNSLRQLDPKKFSNFEFSKTHSKKYKTFEEYMNKSEVKVEPFLYEDRTYVCIMESPYMSEGDLEDYLTKNQSRNNTGVVEDIIDHALVKRIAKTSLKTLKFIHGHGMVHFDIKPANILTGLKTNGPGSKRVFALSDFGFLTDVGKIPVLEPSDQLTLEKLSGYLKGTWLYMAPEQVIFSTDEKLNKTLIELLKMSNKQDSLIKPSEIRAREKLFKQQKDIIDRLFKIGPKADIYALGASLLEVATWNYLNQLNKPHSAYPDPTVPYKEGLLKKLKPKTLSRTDNLFFDFAKTLTQEKPENRPTAAEALKHPYLK